MAQIGSIAYVICFFLIFGIINPLSHLPIDVNSSSFVKANEIKDEAHLCIIPDSDPYYGILGSSYCCRYEMDGKTKFKPLLIAENQALSDRQILFVNQYNAESVPLVLGTSVSNMQTSIEILGNPPQVSLDLAAYLYKNVSRALILPYGSIDDLEYALIASPLASYLNMPVFIVQDNHQQIQSVIHQLSINTIYCVGSIDFDWTVEEQIPLETKEEIYGIILSVIGEKFQDINYLTVTNPIDTLPLQINHSNTMKRSQNLSHTSITLFGKTSTIFGSNTIKFNTSIDNEINLIHVEASYHSYVQSPPSLSSIEPIVSLRIRDPQGNIVSYGFSQGYKTGTVIGETLTCHAPGEYTIEIGVYNGLLGGYFSKRGLSIVAGQIQSSTQVTGLKKPHYPLVPNLSMLSSYLTSIHAGILIADSSYALTEGEYEYLASGSCTGPWYDESLHDINNNKVNITIQEIETVLSIMEEHDFTTDFRNGPAWLAILGDSNMIPMYYYPPSQLGLEETGLPSDNPYSLNHSLSTGRVMAPTVADASLLLCRTFFYEDIIGSPSESNDWHRSFHFIFGEGFGETGGIFHQIPYAKEIQDYGFETEVFGDFRNSRQSAEEFGIFKDANFIEYLGHGDWFWCTPSIYGFDIYGSAIDVAHVNEWMFTRPSVLLTSACLMGRIDGIPAAINIGLSFIHAGCNSFIGATRETGQEAGLELLENSLIIDDMSMGEALREEKRNDQQLPTYLVRTLYGDPAFNPYDPLHGFS